MGLLEVVCFNSDDVKKLPFADWKNLYKGWDFSVRIRVLFDLAPRRRVSFDLAPQLRVFLILLN